MSDHPSVPCADDIHELLTFLPVFERPRFTPIDRLHEGRWPVYTQAVLDFFRCAGRPCWCDYGYDPRHAQRLLDDPAALGRADLAQLRSLLTACVRGERFCDGHWGTLLEQGHITRILQRLATLHQAPS